MLSRRCSQTCSHLTENIFYECNLCPVADFFVWGRYEECIFCVKLNGIVAILEWQRWVFFVGVTSFLCVYLFIDRVLAGNYKTLTRLFRSNMFSQIMKLSASTSALVPSSTARVPPRLVLHKHPRCLHLLRRWRRNKGSDSSSGSWVIDYFSLFRMPAACDKGLTPRIFSHWFVLTKVCWTCKSDPQHFLGCRLLRPIEAFVTVETTWTSVTARTELIFNDWRTTVHHL